MPLVMLLHKSLHLGFILLTAFAGLNAQTPKMQKVLAAELRRFEAMAKADTAALRPMLADDLVYVHSNALKENKLEHLSAISTKKLVYQKMDRQEAGVRIYGKTALVNGLVNVRGVLNGNPFEVRLLYLAAYRKKRGAWVLIHWQSTKKV